jgi:hypothetical protein
VGVLALRGPSSRRRFGGKRVPLDDRNFSEMPGERLSRCKTGHAGTNHHRMISCRIRHVSSWCFKRIKPSLSDLIQNNGERRHKLGSRLLPPLRLQLKGRGTSERLSQMSKRL